MWTFHLRIALYVSSWLFTRVAQLPSMAGSEAELKQRRLTRPIKQLTHSPCMLQKRWSGSLLKYAFRVMHAHRCCVVQHFCLSFS